MEINCLIIDDEQLARKGLSNFIDELQFMHLIGSCSNPIQALELISGNKIDLLFLDIQMPKINGMEFLKTLENPPLTIITTAYPHFAIESFELNVIDYLIKPIPLERFIKAVNKAKDYLILKYKTDPSSDYFFVKCENRYEKITFNELLYVKALQNYVILQTTSKRYISYLTFKSVEEYLPTTEFIKVQKSFIVSLSKIDCIDGNEIKIGDIQIPISRSNKDEILSVIFNNKVLKR